MRALLRLNAAVCPCSLFFLVMTRVFGLDITHFYLRLNGLQRLVWVHALDARGGFLFVFFLLFFFSFFLLQRERELTRPDFNFVAAAMRA